MKNNFTTIAAEKLIKRVAGVYGFSLEDIREKKLIPKELRQLRHMLHWLVYEHTNWGLHQTGEVFHRDHTSIMYSVKRFNKINETMKEEGYRMAQLWLEGFEPPPKPVILVLDNAHIETQQEREKRLMKGVDYSLHEIVERRRNPAIQRLA